MYQHPIHPIPYTHISNNNIYISFKMVCLLNSYIYVSFIYRMFIKSLFKVTYSIDFNIINK